MKSIGIPEKRDPGPYEDSGPYEDPGPYENPGPYEDPEPYEDPGGPRVLGRRINYYLIPIRLLISGFFFSVPYLY